MKRKKRPKKRSAHRFPVSPELEILVGELVREIETRTPDDVVARVPDSHCAQGLIACLPADESVVPLLLALKTKFREKEVAKAIRRAVFRLNQKGVSTQGVYAKEEVPSTILKAPQKEPPRCYVGPVKGSGARAVALILHRGGKGLDAGFGVVSDAEGFQEFFFRTLSRKDAKELREQFSEDAGPFVETSLAHAATILEAAYQRQQAAKSSAPADYLELRPWLLETTPLLERPVIYDLLPESDVSEHVITDLEIKALFEHPLMATWLIEIDALRPFMEDMFRVNESPIVLTEGQKAARVREIQEKCMAQIFTVEERERLRHRLEEMAYLLFKLGQEDTAGIALAAALSVVREASILKADPVVETLLERSLAIYTRAIEEGGGKRIRENESASPIVML